MRKHILTTLLVMLSIVTFGQQWVAIKSGTPSTIQTTLVTSSESQITVNLQIPGFYAIEVTTPHGEANIISVPKTVSTAAAGEPNLPMIAVPAIVGDQALMHVEVIEADFTEFENIEIAPSKGDFPRSINPEDVPYTYGEAYSTDAFFPSQIATLDEPYIHRDVRAQNMMVVPFQYNPVTKVLRVYHRLVLSMIKDGDDSRNVIESRPRSLTLDPEFKTIYENRYINYSASMSRYTPIEENGELLIICHDAFMTAMQPFVNWKKQIGRPTTMVGTSETGNNANAIKSYIQTYYAAHPNLTDILLVGDVAQIPGVYISAGSGFYGYSGYGDAQYGQLAGNDYYNEVIVGRFCCETEAQVTNHVNKVLNYERDLDQTATWLPIGQGVSKNEGAGSGHYGEADHQHIDNIRTDLLNYNYTNVYRDYQGVSGSTASNADAVSQHINEGVSIINYCNHGSEISWGVFSYSNSHVNALTNDYKLPYIISVACLNGKYDHSGGCFAEAWMRATNNTTGNPTGAIGGMFSYISQPWTPPQYGQDEMVDILVESYSNNIRRTMGGVSANGNMKVLDQGANQNDIKGTYNTWILFGDPTLTLRNAIPADMGVTHASSMGMSATSFTVNTSNGNGALATLTRNNEIMGSATINNGTANITFAAPDATGTATLTVFGYNKITYVGTVNITGGTQYYNVSVMANPAEGGTVSGDNAYQQGQSCTVTATPNAGYTFINWTENGEEVSTDASYTFIVTSNRYLMANFEEQAQSYTISVSANPSNGGTVTGDGIYQQGQPCTIHATANAGYIFTNWTENGNVVSNDASFTFTVTGDHNFVANFDIQSYRVKAVANPIVGGIVTGSGNYAYNASCTVTATANSAYTFINWTENGNVVSDNASFTFTVTSDHNLEANFQLQSFTIGVTANPSNGGFVTGGGNYNHGASCTVTATPNQRYEFVNWTENGVEVSTQQSYSFTVTANRDLVANFEMPMIEITTSVDPQEAASVIGAGTYNYGDEVTLTIVRNEDYAFQNWTENGIVVSEEMTYTFVATENRNLVAHFQYTEGISENSVSAKVYPNPTSGDIILEGEGLSHLRIVNAYGQTVYNAKIEGEQVHIDLSNMAKGIYMMHIETNDGQAVRKIVVE